MSDIKELNNEELAKVAGGVSKEDTKKATQLLKEAGDKCKRNLNR